MIHSRSMWALCIALSGGYLGGGMVSTPVGLIVALAAGMVALKIAPHAETVARDWKRREDGGQA